MKINKKYTKILSICLLFWACNPEPSITDDLLDGNVVVGPSIGKKDHLVSYTISRPTEAEKNTPVIVLGHGFSATTFEWSEFKEWIDENHKGKVFVSRVLLKGHGRNYKTFKNSTWKQWQDSIKEEYERLMKLGFNNISLGGSSTSGALILDLFSAHYFKDKTKPKNVFLIDALVVPSSKMLSLVNLVGHIIGYSDTGADEKTKKYWYRYYPQEALKQLNGIVDQIQSNLEDGITLTKGTYLKAYKSKIDKVVEPVSAVLIYKGVKTYTGERVDVDIVDSNLHVFTRLKARKKVTDKDRKNQQNTFTEMYNKLVGK